MPIDRVWIEDGCTACGICEEICPEVFVLDEREEVAVRSDVNLSAYEEEIKQAAESCPVDAVVVQET